MTPKRRGGWSALAMLVTLVMSLPGVVVPCHADAPPPEAAPETTPEAAPESSPASSAEAGAPSAAPQAEAADAKESASDAQGESTDASPDQADPAPKADPGQAAKPGQSVQADDGRSADTPSSDQPTPEPPPQVSPEAPPKKPSQSSADDKPADATSPATPDDDAAPLRPRHGRPASADFLNALQDRLRTVESVQADFIQTKRLAIFEHEVTLRGRFALAKPDRLIWVVRQPVRYAMLLQGHEIRQWDQDTRNVQTIRLNDDPAFKAVTQQLQAWFLGDYKILAEVFDVQVTGEKPLSLAFIPKKDGMAAQFLQHVGMTFGSDDRHVASLTLFEAGGDVTTLRFINARLDEPVPAHLWDIPPHDFK